MHEVQNLVVRNLVGQDHSVVVIFEGVPRLVSLPKKSEQILLDVETTSELQGLVRRGAVQVTKLTGLR